MFPPPQLGGMKNSSPRLVGFGCGCHCCPQNCVCTCLVFPSCHLCIVCILDSPQQLAQYGYVAWCVWWHVCVLGVEKGVVALSAKIQQVNWQFICALKFWTTTCLPSQHQSHTGRVARLPVNTKALSFQWPDSQPTPKPRALYSTRGDYLSLRCFILLF